MEKEELLKEEKQPDEKDVQVKANQLLGVTITALLVLFYAILTVFHIILKDEATVSINVIMSGLLMTLFSGWCAKAFYVYAKRKDKKYLIAGIIFAVGVAVQLAVLIVALI